MMLLRLPLTVLLGGSFTVAVFWLLWNLVEQRPDVGETIEARRIEFTRMRRDTEVATKREERVEREPPPPTPEMPRIAISRGGVSNNIVPLTPVVDTAGTLTGIGLSAGSDTEVVPLVRIPPEYPPRALSRGIEGWVQVQFTITETGAVKDAIVVDAEPEGVFEEAALRSIARWRYNPKVEDGVAVERVGVQTIIRFELEDG
ncbi:MAG TPA: energy transducer TonB [Gammaproteobacteria bacterium]